MDVFQNAGTKYDSETLSERILKVAPNFLRAEASKQFCSIHVDQHCILIHGMIDGVYVSSIAIEISSFIAW